MEKENYDHEFYKHCEEKDADAIAWAFVNKHKMVRFPFKFPPVGPKELRANILYAGLCHSDVLTAREEWGPTTFPLAPGHEIIAEVSMVGSEVKFERLCLGNVLNKQSSFCICVACLTESFQQICLRFMNKREHLINEEGKLSAVKGLLSRFKGPVISSLVLHNRARDGKRRRGRQHRAKIQRQQIATGPTVAIENSYYQPMFPIMNNKE